MAGTGTHSRGRPQRAELRRTQQDILQAATQHFALRGYDTAPVRQIAYDADVQPGTIYAHFHSKWGLLRAVLDAVGPGVVVRLSEELHDPDGLPTFCGGVMAAWTQPMARLAFSLYLLRGHLPTASLDLQSLSSDLRPEVAQALYILRKRLEGWPDLPATSQELTCRVMFPLLSWRQEQEVSSATLIQRSYQHGEALRAWVLSGSGGTP